MQKPSIYLAFLFTIMAALSACNKADGDKVAESLMNNATDNKKDSASIDETRKKGHEAFDKLLNNSNTKPTNK